MMMFDHLAQTQEELIGHIKAACKALQFLREVDPYEAVVPGSVKDQWVRHMNALNTARVRLSMAAEYLHEDLNHFNDEVIAAGRGDDHTTTVGE